MADKTENTKEFNSKEQERLILGKLSESKIRMLENRRKGEEVNKKEEVPETQMTPKKEETKASESNMKNLEKKAREMELEGDETESNEINSLKAEMKSVKEELKTAKENLEKEQRKNEVLKEESRGFNMKWLEAETRVAELRESVEDWQRQVAHNQGKAQEYLRRMNRAVKNLNIFYKF